MTTIQKFTTRSRATAEAIRDRVPFTTSGALRGETFERGVSAWASGRLSGIDLDAFRSDMREVDYIVFSYATPIAWHVTYPNGSGRWHRVSQKFSVTTSKHQSNLYLIG